jgi:shikimate kinase
MSPPRPIALVGLPAVGKSTIGRRLARMLGRDFVDLDDLIEEGAGTTIASIFEEHGETRFRELELQSLTRVALPGSAVVIATGGGVVVDERCRSLLAGRTHVVYLRALLPGLVSRVSRTGKRPLFRSVDAGAKMLDMQQHRDPLYREVASVTVDVDGRSPSSVVQEIAEQLRSIEHSPSKG